VTGDRRRFLRTTAFAGGGLAAGVAGLNWLSPRIWPELIDSDSNHSQWATSRPARRPALARDLEADVAIVGAGFTGLSAAHYIRNREPSKRVVVLEARGCGNGASGRNGGMVLSMTADRFMQFGPEPALDKRIYELTVENIQRLSSLSHETGIDCELETNGALQVFNSPADLEAGRAYVDRARSLGMPVELWDEQKTAAALGTSLYQGAFFDPSCGQVHPMKLVQVLLAAAEQSGAEIYEATPVASVEEGNPLRLHTAGGPVVKARSLVLATNAYSSRLGYFRNAIVPVFNYVGMTAPLSESLLAEVGWRSRLPFSDSRTLVTYLGLTRDNRIHIGGGRADYAFGDGVRPQVDAEAVRPELLSELGRIFPRLAGAGVALETVWGGVVDCSLDFSPSVGCLRDNVYYGIGYSGHGVNLSSLFGRIIADLVAGQGRQWEGLPFVNRSLPYVPNEPFRWLGVRTAMEITRLTDPKTP